MPARFRPHPNRPIRRLAHLLFSKLLETAARCRMISPERLYRFQAGRHGVQYLGIFAKHRVVLFQDPVTQSSFAIREGDPLESGIHRVRSRFGLV